MFVVLTFICGCSKVSVSGLKADLFLLDLYKVSDAIYTEGVHYGTQLDIYGKTRGFFVCDTRINSDGTYTSRIDFVQFDYNITEYDGKLFSDFKIVSKEKCVVESYADGEIVSMRYTESKESDELQYSSENFCVSLIDLEGKSLSAKDSKYGPDGSIEIQTYAGTAENISKIEYRYSAHIKTNIGKELGEQDIEIVFETK